MRRIYTLTWWKTMLAVSMLLTTTGCLSGNTARDKLISFVVDTATLIAQTLLYNAATGSSG